MKTSCRSFINKLLFGIGLLTFSYGAAAQNPTPQPLTPEQQAAKLKAHWKKPLEDLQREFQNNNDRESAAFVGGVLDSLDKPDGMTPASLERDFEHIKKQVRDLVRSGAMESAAGLNTALGKIGNSPSGKSGPASPNHKTGGTPGPGGLVLYFSFDKADVGGTIHDESGAGNDGRVFGAKWTPDGKIGGAYEFHITNLTDRIVIPNSDTLNPDSITITAWVKAADRDGFWNRIADKDWRNGYCLSLGGDFNGKATRGRLSFEPGRGDIDTSRTLSDNQWHHVAASYDGKIMRCYIDGTGPPERAVKNPGPLKKSPWDLCIGNSVVEYGSGEFNAFDGLIDEVRIYNRALSMEEIKALATATKVGADILPPTASATPAAAKPDPAERLKKVKALYDQGLINKEDYDKKVTEIMDSL